jgi:asparagine synthase (glutamine-hydrolysing)
MCGIFALLNTNSKNDNTQLTIIKKQFDKGKKRGPEYSKLDNFYLKMVLGFHRLAINGLDSISNQPIVYKDVVLICNGEIYNFKQLYNYMKVTPVTNSDCEVIIHLYIKYGIEQTLTMLDGVFSFVLYDNRLNDELTNHVYVARDPFGVRPLYQVKLNTEDNELYGFASELKCLEYFYNTWKLPHIKPAERFYNNLKRPQNTIGQFEPGTYSVYKYGNNLNHLQNTIGQFEPGTYSVYQYGNKVCASWEQIITNKPYFIPTFAFTRLSHDVCVLKEDMFHNISKYLNSAVIKRCTTTERPIACLLSGGLDSSLIAALVANYFGQKDQTIETYSIGLENSEDIKYARIVANYIGTRHTEIIVTENEMFDIIPELIKALESYDTTTVRASIGNYLIGKYISEHSEAKVIFNGDGADELFGGYLYMNKCPDDIEFDKETRRLLKDIHLFDVLRSDKSISSNGLEPRTPFLDKSFVNYVLSIPPYFRNHNNFQKQEKYLLRTSFSHNYFEDFTGRQILPDEILLRKKEAFSDGVSCQSRSLFTILQELISNKYASEHKPSIELEKKYYKEIFDEEFLNCEHILPYFWMPKYINATDPSARTLELYT